MTDRPPLPTSESSNSNGALEPAVEAFPPILPPPYQEVIDVAQTYPPQYIPHLENRQDVLPGYSVNGPFKLTGARILNLVGWAIGITTAILGLRNQAISSSTLAVALVILCTGLYVLEKYKEDCHGFAPWLFEEDYKSHVVHGGEFVIDLAERIAFIFDEQSRRALDTSTQSSTPPVLCWYPSFVTMLHVVEVYINTHGIKREPKDGVVSGLICLTTFLSFLFSAYLGRWVMVSLQFPSRLRLLGERNPFYLLVVEEAIILIPRVVVCLVAPSFQMSPELWALENRRAAQASCLQGHDVDEWSLPCQCLRDDSCWNAYE
ncbi:hypothetical protein M407DRAFT_9977 [Tulasnella calospora MUT 4182]|uniref:Uncharacterized protein n=1 Tax=Tulasnella calospora MUT 4182 TaxID=1051891 RepID=A0A0C3Q200_9AGAM|nr:hypothetical protein M407DRAFT_9977 [Tulasnella calospora MUT 4182]